MNDEMFGYPITHYTVERNGNVPVDFDGVILGQVRSTPSQKRWSETTIYYTDKGNWVVAMFFYSEAPGEVTKRVVKVCATPDDVREALTRRPKNGAAPYMSRHEINCLNDAINVDNRLAAALVERV